MLSSIHPLGERARGNRWWRTVSAFGVASTATGAAIGAAMGGLGSLTGWRDDLTAVAIGAIAVIAAGLDALGVRAPGPTRQVNERWIGEFRGWVYGAGFGAQLGTGLATYVVTWGVWVTVAAEVLSGSAAGGALIGSVFGATRSLSLVAAARIDRPSRLASFHARMAALAAPSHLGSALAVGVVGAAAIVVGA